MVAVKIISLVLYVILAYVAVTQPLTLQANVSLGLLVLLGALHLVECVMYKDIIFSAPGSTVWHMLNIFLFGFIHMLYMRKAIREAEELRL
jgi:uncharacterized protein YhhL (DUF1145 family)